jgi:hypothetical protein
MFVSNITESWGLEESNFVWRNNAASPDEARRKMLRGTAPFDNKAAEMNLAWVGWGWDAKMGDFDNSGNLAVVQTSGFVKGDINRFNWLQELAMSNDLMLQEPAMWPKAEPGDDIAGENHVAFWAPEGNGRYTDLSKELGLAARWPTPTATAARTSRSPASGDRRSSTTTTTPAGATSSGYGCSAPPRTAPPAPPPTAPR